MRRIESCMLRTARARGQLTGRSIEVRYTATKLKCSPSHPERRGAVLATATRYLRKPKRLEMTLRSRLILGLLTIAVILVIPLLIAVRAMDRLHHDARALRDNEFAASLLL